MNIVSAKYANLDHTSAIVATADDGACAISQADTPEVWAQLLASDITIEPFDSDPLATARAAKWEQIKADRDAAEFGTFIYEGMEFDGDAVAKSRLEGACLFVVVLQMQGQPFQTDWTLHDNTVVSLTGEQLISAAIARAGHVDAVFARGRQLRDLILDPATTLKDLTGIEWTE